MIYDFTVHGDLLDLFGMNEPTDLVHSAFDKDDMAWAMGILRDRKSIKSDACDNLAEN